MCGIGGILCPRQELNEKQCADMLGALAHRGPDGRGQLTLSCGKGLALGLVHSRLAIIDLSEKASQPMTDPGSGNCIVYNGELYNYRELRGELERLGRRFVSNSDTEVILAAFSQWGRSCLDRFRGMFAFCIWEPRREALFLAVDRFGIKPLYYSAASGAFIFASELRAVLASGKVSRRIDPAGLNSYLAFGAVQAPLTINAGVRQLLPGRFLEVKLAGITIEEHQYWQPLREEERVGMSARECRSSVREALRDSVNAHLVSDVPVGVFLSGGIDSSIIAGLAHAQAKDALQSFSVIFNESAYSEQKYSSELARHLGLRHNEITLTQDQVLECLPDALSAMDQPTVDGINVFVISRAVREKGIKVVLSGQGGDELFGGYPTFQRMPLLKSLSSSRLAPLAARLFAPGPFDSSRQKIIQILRSKGDTVKLYAILRQLFAPQARRQLIPRQILPEIGSGIDRAALDAVSSASGLGSFNAVSLLEQRSFLANMLLRDGDFMSMAHGLEIRVPFLDPGVASAINRVPGRIKSSLPAKSFLVDSFSDLLPPAIYRRNKMGFVFPWELWLRDKMAGSFTGLLDGLAHDQAGGLDVRSCRTVWELFSTRRGGVSWSRVWALYVYLRWFERNMHG